MVLWCSGILLEMMFQQIDAEDIERWLRRLLPGAAGSLPFRLSARGCGFESAASQCHPKAIGQPRYPESHTPSSKRRSHSLERPLGCLYRSRRAHVPTRNPQCPLVTRRGDNAEQKESNRKDRCACIGVTRSIEKFTESSSQRRKIFFATLEMLLDVAFDYLSVQSIETVAS